MLTIFSTCKPFTTDRIRTAQRNAITSWALLKPSPRIILFGNEEFEPGTAEIAHEFGCDYMDVDHNKFGTPLMDDLFLAAQRHARNPIVAYVNADIILFQDFVDATIRVMSALGQFLMIGSRWDLKLDYDIQFHSNWEANLRTVVREHAKKHSPKGVDYFIFRRGLYREEHLRAFAIGRWKWDGWLVWKILERGIPVVDVTQVITAIHQNHELYPGKSSKGTVSMPPEVRKNRRLSKSRPWLVFPDGTKAKAGQLRHATWELTQMELRQKEDEWTVKP